VLFEPCNPLQLSTVRDGYAEVFFVFWALSPTKSFATILM
jgi:hypothetical protein